jgi:hypothetical protein
MMISSVLVSMDAKQKQQPYQVMAPDFHMDR